MKKPKRKWPIAILCISVAVLLYYLHEEHTVEVVTIYPSQKPARIKPTEAGGIVLPNTDSSIYESLKPGNRHLPKTVNMAAEPEKPIKMDYDEDPLDSIISEFVPIVSPKTEVNEEQELNVISVANEKANTDKVIGRKSRRNYALQLAVVKSESDGIKEWQKISKKCGKVVGKLEMRLEKVQNRQDRIFYLLLAGNYSNAGEAKVDCRKLARYQQNCTIYEFKN